VSTEKARDAFQQWMDKTSYIKISFPGGAADRALRELAEIIALISPPEPPLPDAAEQLYVIKKGYFYYRANCSGYTDNIDEAGRYSKQEAEREARIEPWHMQAIPAPPTKPDLAGKIATLTAQLAEARGLLEREEKAHLNTIDRRDAAEDAISEAYCVVTGQPAEWSNGFGYDAALEHIQDKINDLTAHPQPARNDVATLKAMIRLTALRWVPGITYEQIDAHIDAALAGKAAIEPQPTHADDAAIDAFAAAMKGKMAASRAKGRSGWEGCPVAELSAMLRDHVAKGDPLDVANFAMMIWHTGGPMARIEGQPAPDVVHVRWEWQQDRGVRTDVLHPSLILFAGALQVGQITYSSAGKVFRADIWTWEYWREFDTLEAAKAALLAALNGGE